MSCEMQFLCNGSVHLWAHCLRSRGSVCFGGFVFVRGVRSKCGGSPTSVGYQPAGYCQLPTRYRRLSAVIEAAAAGPLDGGALQFQALCPWRCGQGLLLCHEPGGAWQLLRGCVY